MNQDQDLLQDIELPMKWKARASRNKSQKSQVPTPEAVVPFVVEAQVVSSSLEPKRDSWLITTWYRLKIAIGVIMVLFSFVMLALIVMMWPVLVSATSSVMSCNPQVGITAGCPKVVPANFAVPRK